MVEEADIQVHIEDGGGATHIALRSGLLSTLSSYIDEILLVAGGGGASSSSSRSNKGGDGGGYIGDIGNSNGGRSYRVNGGTQTAGGRPNSSSYGRAGSFGQGGAGRSPYGCGGGGGFYGGAGSAGYSYTNSSTGTTITYYAGGGRRIWLLRYEYTEWMYVSIWFRKYFNCG
mgnify:CR=1 FL=1